MPKNEKVYLTKPDSWLRPILDKICHWIDKLKGIE